MSASSSLNDARWCGECHVYLYPNVPPPKSHIRHAGKGIGVTSTFCNVCHETIYDGLSPSPGHLRHMQRDAQASKQRQQEAMIKAEQEPQNAIKIIDRGKYVKTAGIIPGEDVVVHEKIAQHLAKKRSGSDQK